MAIEGEGDAHVRDIEDSNSRPFFLLAGAISAVLVSCAVWQFVNDDVLRCGIAGMGCAAFLALCGFAILIPWRRLGRGGAPLVCALQILSATVVLNAFVLAAHSYSDESGNVACKWVALSGLPLLVPYFTCATIVSLLFAGLCMLLMYAAESETRRTWFWRIGAMAQFVLGVTVLPVALLYYAFSTKCVDEDSRCWLATVRESMPSRYADALVDYCRWKGGSNSYDVYKRAVREARVSLAKLEELSTKEPQWYTRHIDSDPQIAFWALCEQDEQRAANLVLRLHAQDALASFRGSLGSAGRMLGLHADLPALHRLWTDVTSDFGSGILHGVAGAKRTECSSLAARLIRRIRLDRSCKEYAIERAMREYCSFAPEQDIATFLREEIQGNDDAHHQAALWTLDYLLHSNTGVVSGVVCSIFETGAIHGRTVILESRLPTALMLRMGVMRGGVDPFWGSAENVRERFILALSRQLKEEDVFVRRASAGILARIVGVKLSDNLLWRYDRGSLLPEPIITESEAAELRELKVRTYEYLLDPKVAIAEHMRIDD